MLAYLRGTSTSTGLEVQAFLWKSVYATGQSVSDTEMQALNLERHTVCPNWNYTIRPRRAGTFSGAADSTSREVII